MKVFGCLLALLFVFQHAATVEVDAEAKSVVLPCSVTLEDRKDLSVVWRRKDLNPSVIHFKEQGRDDLDNQNQNYRGRTSVSDPLQENGLASLTLSEPRLNDSGTYTCIIRREGKDLHRTEVPLLVNVCQHAAAVEVNTLAKSVVLPCSVTLEDRKDLSVVWRRKDLNPSVIHFKEQGRDDLDTQNQNFRGRTSVSDSLQENGLASLTLSEPRLNDSGTYTCIIRREGKDLHRTEVPLLVNVCQHAAAVEVDAGAKSVVLPCSVNLEDRKDLSVVWRREDLNPSIIHFKEQGRDDVDKQNQNYRGRTSVSDPLQENGLASLTLSEPRLNDSGTYTCIIRREGGDLHREEVPLLVNETIVQKFSLCWGFCAALLGTFICFFGACCWRRNTRAAVASVCRVIVREGAGLVKLPYQATVDLHAGTIVEWILSGPKPKVVHRQVIGCDQPEKQPEVYYERTEMTNLETGDLSLTLSDPCCEDSGIYICNVRRDGVILAQKVVEVLVQVFLVMAREGEESVKLPFKIPLEVFEGVTVEWSLSGPEHKVVLRCVIGSDQPVDQHEFYHLRSKMSGPLSLDLVLEDPRREDSGIFICTVHRGGVILAQKVVELQVQRQYCAQIRAETPWFRRRGRRPQSYGDIHHTWQLT
ncbi:uncharacterized protein LOC111650764 isoform X1 [Seriola lalandi dorsalis]|uniref:uncharacterized protein LOC111650764 isoform X1 n=1 Tax=Seriola lalandi dorsalis TaxID=1841481 RepID=UPI000C6F8F01|nr:uncharacterized protein LOC111650764 isoform X1 [Seriola lalandi dorsalis]